MTNGIESIDSKIPVICRYKLLLRDPIDFRQIKISIIVDNNFLVKITILHSIVRKEKTNFKFHNSRKN